jgi:hypothetical protein
MAKLCKAGAALREAIDDAFPDRSRRRDGWIGDARHAARKSDHNPTAEGVVRALDIDADLGSKSAEAFDFADQLRLLARHDKRISYIIFNHKIASWKGNYKWRAYKGLNPHVAHIHISFTAKGDNDGSMFRIPLLTGEPINGRVKKNRRKLGKIFSSSSTGDVFSSGLETGNNSDQRGCCRCTCNNSIPKR